MVNERTAKLRDTVAELEGLSYSLVHDLRAPLRAMQSYAGIVEQEAGPRLRPEENDLLRKIRTASDRMDHLITDSLNYTRILRQDLPIGPVNLGALLRGMVETYPDLHRPQADITIEFTDLPWCTNPWSASAVASPSNPSRAKAAPSVSSCCFRPRRPHPASKSRVRRLGPTRAPARLRSNPGVKAPLENLPEEPMFKVLG